MILAKCTLPTRNVTYGNLTFFVQENVTTIPNYLQEGVEIVQSCSNSLYEEPIHILQNRSTVLKDECGEKRMFLNLNDFEGALDFVSTYLTLYLQTFDSIGIASNCTQTYISYF